MASTMDSKNSENDDQDYLRYVKRIENIRNKSESSNYKPLSLEELEFYNGWKKYWQHTAYIKSNSENYSVHNAPLVTELQPPDRFPPFHFAHRWNSDSKIQERMNKRISERHNRFEREEKKYKEEKEYKFYNFDKLDKSVEKITENIYKNCSSMFYSTKTPGQIIQVLENTLFSVNSIDFATDKSEKKIYGWFIDNGDKIDKYRTDSPIPEFEIVLYKDDKDDGEDDKYIVCLFVQKQDLIEKVSEVFSRCEKSFS